MSGEESAAQAKHNVGLPGLRPGSRAVLSGPLPSGFTLTNAFVWRLLAALIATPALVVFRPEINPGAPGSAVLFAYLAAALLWFIIGGAMRILQMNWGGLAKELAILAITLAMFGIAFRFQDGLRFLAMRPIYQLEANSRSTMDARPPLFWSWYESDNYIEHIMYDPAGTTQSGRISRDGCRIDTTRLSTRFVLVRTMCP